MFSRLQTVLAPTLSASRTNSAIFSAERRVLFRFSCFGFLRTIHPFDIGVPIERRQGLEKCLRLRVAGKMVRRLVLETERQAHVDGVAAHGPADPNRVCGLKVENAPAFPCVACD